MQRREALLAEMKDLKKEYAGGAMYREEFETRQDELRRLVEENRKEMERGRETEISRGA